MARAEITFALPTTRVNSANLPESELAHVDVYDNAYDDGRENAPQNLPDPAIEDEGTENSHIPAQPSGDTAQLEKQRGSRYRRRKIGQWTNEKAGITPRFETDELTPGVHYFQLVAVDTDGRVASPSPAFRLNVNVPGDKSTPKDNDEPPLSNNVTVTGSDQDRPSHITKVQVKLL
jgi:hypothetical protein